MLNASTFDIQFNRAVNPELTTIKLDGEKIDRKYITFNANRTFATIALPDKLKSGTHEVTVSTPGMKEALAKEINIEAEKVKTIEILGDTAVRVAGDKVSIGYRAFNQYGEEMENAKLDVKAEGNVVANRNPDLKDGRVLIPIDKHNVQEGEEIKLTLSKGDAETTKRVKVSTNSSVYKLEIEGLSPDEKIKETTDLKKEPFYVLVKVTDQFGEPITDGGQDLTDTFTATSTNPNVIDVEQTLERVSDEEDSEEGLYKLKLIGKEQDGASVPSVGRTSIVLTANASNQKSQPFAITVDEGQRVDTFDLEIPENITAGSNLEIPLKPLDKEGNPITSLEIVKGAISGIAWSFDPKIPAKVKKDSDGNLVEVKDDDNTEEGQLYLTFKGEDLIQGPLEITGVTATNERIVKTITVNEQAKPKTWAWKEGKEPEYDFVRKPEEDKDDDLDGENGSDEENGTPEKTRKLLSQRRTVQIQMKVTVNRKKIQKQVGNLGRLNLNILL